jgi:hypothetical protein
MVKKKIVKTEEESHASFFSFFYSYVHTMFMLVLLSTSNYKVY